MSTEPPTSNEPRADPASTNAVELDPELAACLEDNFICHPLIHGSTHPDVAALHNAALHAKERELKEAYAPGDWHTVVFLHERPCRAMTFHHGMGQVTDPDEWWSLFADVWSDTESFSQDIDLWNEILDSAPTCGSPMTEEEQAELAELPDLVHVFRGVGGEDQPFGYSWTLDRARAEWFARRFSAIEGPPVLIEGRVPRHAVIAYFEERNEREIVVRPEDVEVSHTQVLHERNDDGS